MGWGGLTHTTVCKVGRIVGLGGGGGGKRERGRERERESSNSNSKTLFYKDCSLGSVKEMVLAKLLMNRYKITGIIYTYRHE